MKQLVLALAIAATALAPVAAYAASLDSFDYTANAAIPGQNVEHLNQSTPEMCAAACLATSRASWCVSFDYFKTQQGCDLSDKRAADVGGLKTNYSGNPYDHYSIKEPLRSFTFTANAAISGYNNEHLTNVSPADCATACLASDRSGWCRSFDYTKATQACDLSDHRARDVGGLKIDYSGNPYDHYSLAPVNGVANPVPGNKHLLLIGIDGLRGDAIDCTGCAQTPGLDSLIQGGAVHHNILAGGTQATLSGPGWSTIYTGFWADQHGVTSNDIALPLLKPHIFDVIKQAWPTATTAVVADWANQTHNLLPKQADYVVTNEAKNSQEATDAVKHWLGMSNAPTAIFYYLHNVDIHAASYDPLNAYYQSKIVGEDQQIQQVLAALAARPNYANEEWLIVVASDHGGINSGHGGQTAAERDSILIMNNNYLNPTKTAYCTGDLSSVTMTQADGVTPHVLDFFGLPNATAGTKYAGCGH